MPSFFATSLTYEERAFESADGGGGLGGQNGGSAFDGRGRSDAFDVRDAVAGGAEGSLQGLLVRELGVPEQVDGGAPPVLERLGVREGRVRELRRPRHRRRGGLGRRRGGVEGRERVEALGGLPRRAARRLAARLVALRRNALALLRVPPLVAPLAAEPLQLPAPLRLVRRRHRGRWRAGHRHSSPSKSTRSAAGTSKRARGRRRFQVDNWEAPRPAWGSPPRTPAGGSCRLLPGFFPST